MTGRSAYDWMAGLGGHLVRIGAGLCVVFVAACVGFGMFRFVFVHLDAAMERWAAGGNVDLQGIAAFVGALGAFIAIVWPLYASSSRDRRLRDIEVIRSGGAQPPGPTQPSTDSSAPSAESSPSGGLVNNEALR